MQLAHYGLIGDTQRGASHELAILPTLHRRPRETGEMSRKILTRTRTENNRKLHEIARMYDVTAERNRVQAELESVARKERLLGR